MTKKPSGDALRRLIKPTLDTQFHIDYAWWEGNERQLQLYLMSFLPEEQRNSFDDEEKLPEIDTIDPVTAEVRRVDPVARAIQEASSGVDYSHTSLVDAIFRVFLTNNNTPLTPSELSDIIGKPPNTILRTIGSTRVYKGLRPFAES